MPLGFGGGSFGLTAGVVMPTDGSKSDFAAKVAVGKQCQGRLLWLHMVSVIVAAKCKAGMLGMLGEIAVGLAGLVQFREAGTLVLE